MPRTAVFCAALAFAPTLVLAQPSAPIHPIFPFNRDVPLSRAAQYTQIGVPVLNNAGQVAFTASVGQPGLRGSFTGLWVGEPGSPTTTLSSSNLIPGLPSTVLLASLGNPVLNGHGDVAVTASLSGDTVTADNRAVLISTVGGVPQVIARGGERAPGTPEGVFYRSFEQPRLSDTGRVAVFGTVYGASVNTANLAAIWAGPVAGPLSLVARTGDGAPGVDGARFASLMLPSLNDAGQLAFGGIMTGGGVRSSSDAGIWAGMPGALAIAVREGAAAPGCPEGVRFSAFSMPTITPDGRITFSAGLVGVGVVPGNDAGVWSGTVSSVQLLARTGSAVPGAPGALLATVGTPRISTSGHVVFAGTVAGPAVTLANDVALWSGVPGDLRLVAREGNRAPSTEPGTNFASFSAPAINARGQVVFFAQLTGPEVGSGDALALYGWDPINGLLLLARTGTDIEVEPGVFLKVSDIRAATESGNQDGRASSLNDTGQVVFNLTFANGRAGIYISNVAPCLADVAAIGGAFYPDGAITVDDYTSFINAIAENYLAADIVGIGGFPPADGQLTVDDYTSFLNSFAFGCN